MTTERQFENGPYLSAALLCERVLEERDGVKSAIRILDRVNRTVVGPGAPGEMEPFEFTVFLLLRLKAGTARGNYDLTIRLVKPSGESPPPMVNTVNFEGEEDRGVDVVAQIVTRFEQQGLYWFDVSLDEARLTRIPLRIIYARQTIQQAGGS